MSRADPRIVFFTALIAGLAGILTAATGTGWLEVVGIVVVAAAGATCTWAQERIAHLGGHEWNPAKPWWRNWNDMDRRPRQSTTPKHRRRE